MRPVCARWWWLSLVVLLPLQGVMLPLHEATHHHHAGHDHAHHGHAHGHHHADHGHDDGTPTREHDEDCDVCLALQQSRHQSIDLVGPAIISVAPAVGDVGWAHETRLTGVDVHAPLGARGPPRG